MRLKNKSAVVTGAGSGIGEAIAATFAEEGAEVVTVGRTAEKLEAARGRAGAAAERLHPFTLDVSDREAVARLARFAFEKLGKVDLLVNNAGTNVPDRALSKLSNDDWERMVEVNLNGPFYLVREFLPGMRERGDGLIITVSSVAGVRASALAGAGYAASKHGAAALGLSIGLEEGANGVRSCVICPGEVNTPILENRPVIPDAEARAKMLQPEDLAQAALLAATLHPRASIPLMVISPTIQKFA